MHRFWAALSALAFSVSIVAAPEPDWVLEAGADADVPILGEVTDVLRLSDGRTAIVDRQQLVVVLLDQEGAALRVLPFGGEGPGETTAPVKLVEFPAGRLSIVSMTGPTLAMLPTEGFAAESLTLPYPEGMEPSWLEDAAFRHGVFAVCGAADRRTETEMETVWRIYCWTDADALPSVLMASAKERTGAGTTLREVDEGDAVKVWGLNGSGDLVSADRYDLCRTRVLSADGSIVRVDVVPDYDSVQRSDERYAALKKRYEAMLRFVRGANGVEIERIERDIQRIEPASDGGYYLWTSQTNRALETGEALQILHWSADGTQLETLRCEVSIVPECDQTWIRGDHLYVLRGGWSSLRAARRTSDVADQALGEDPCVGGGDDGDLECYALIAP